MTWNLQFVFLQLHLAVALFWRPGSKIKVTFNILWVVLLDFNPRCLFLGPLLFGYLLSFAAV